MNAGAEGFDINDSRGALQRVCAFLPIGCPDSRHAQNVRIFVNSAIAVGIGISLGEHHLNIGEDNPAAVVNQFGYQFISILRLAKLVADRFVVSLISADSNVRSFRHLDDTPFRF